MAARKQRAAASRRRPLARRRPQLDQGPAATTLRVVIGGVSLAAEATSRAFQDSYRPPARTARARRGAGTSRDITVGDVVAGLSVELLATGQELATRLDEARGWMDRQVASREPAFVRSRRKRASVRIAGMAAVGRSEERTGRSIVEAALNRIVNASIDEIAARTAKELVTSGQIAGAVKGGGQRLAVGASADVHGVELRLAHPIEHRLRAWLRRPEEDRASPGSGPGAGAAAAERNGAARPRPRRPRVNE